MSTFNANPVHTAVSLTQAGSLQGTPTRTHTPQAGAAANFGIEAPTAWGTGGQLRSLNARNSGSFFKFNTGQNYAPVEMR